MYEIFNFMLGQHPSQIVRNFLFSVWSAFIHDMRKIFLGGIKNIFLYFFISMLGL